MDINKKNIKILVIDDEKNICWLLKRLFLQKGYTVTEAVNGKEALKKLEEDKYNLIFLDIIMPDISGFEILDKIVKIPNHPPTVIMTAQSTMKNAVEAMKRGAYDYITKPFNLDDVEKIAERAVETYLKSRKINTTLTEKQKINEIEEDIFMVGKSPAMKEIFKLIGKIADSDATVLIQGERGTGKDLVARAIHLNSKRAVNPFISVNCAAIPKDLLESELFGYEKGAFTGATERKIGKFEVANNGVLFLDEIGDMSVELQAKILRVLEEKEIVPIGGTKAVKIDVKIIAATNQDIINLIKNKAFRADLFDRLNQIPIYIPPLRERKEDIPELVRYFLKKFSKEIGIKKDITDDAINFLMAYDWPGNVRELQNTIKRVFLISPNDVLDKSDFLFLTKGEMNKDVVKELSLEEMISWKLDEFIKFLSTGEIKDVHDFVMSQVEKPLIEKILKITKGNQIKASEILGINRNTLRKKIKDYRLDCIDFKKTNRKG
ncbi:MAG: sigma-54 dependent transcriptional regulator [Proteobacteria bacterium]|nr:sigma-54 dependent transcriptional regulator [Pseudomonadota bacterium]